MRIDERRFWFMAAMVGILAVGVAALNHETLNDPVKLGAFIESAPRQVYKIVHVVWGQIVVENKQDGTFVGVHTRKQGLGRLGSANSQQDKQQNHGFHNRTHFSSRNDRRAGLLLLPDQIGDSQLGTNFFAKAFGFISVGQPAQNDPMVSLSTE